MPDLIDTYSLDDVDMPVYEQMVAEKLVPHESVEVTSSMTWECWGYEDGTRPGDQHIYAGGQWLPLHFGPYPDPTRPLPVLTSTEEQP